MFITSDKIVTEQTITQPERLVDGAIVLMRALARVFGLGLVMAASGLWLLPGSLFVENLLLMKLGLSVCAACAGLGFMQHGVVPPQPDVQIDTRMNTIRIVEWTQMHNPVILQECAFDRLSHVEREGHQLRFWDNDSEFLTEVTISDEATMERVLQRLRESVGRG
ncbi:MAG: hypothetical protein P1U53_05485 [Sulfitobacter sp.]|nr:hypothetical protein [Sulfitobacter sp.]